MGCLHLHSASRDGTLKSRDTQQVVRLAFSRQAVEKRRTVKCCCWFAAYLMRWPVKAS